MDLRAIRLRTHARNVQRYRRLLQTQLTELERDFVNRRLAEERRAIEELQAAQRGARPSGISPQPSQHARHDPCGAGA
jgi:hypothetical protein